MKVEVNEISQKNLLTHWKCPLGDLHSLSILYLALKLYEIVSVRDFNICAIRCSLIQNLDGLSNRKFQQSSNFG